MNRFRTFFGTVLPFVLVATGVFLYLDPEQSGNRLSQWKQDVLSGMFPATDFAEPAAPEPAAVDGAAAPAPAGVKPVVPAPVVSAPVAAPAPAPALALQQGSGRRDLTSVLGLEGAVEQAPLPQLAGIPQAPAVQVVVPLQTERRVPPAYPVVPQPQRPDAQMVIASPPSAPVGNRRAPSELPSIWTLPEQFGEPAGGWLLNRARQAFWEQDYRAAVEAYRQLLTEQAGDPGLWGELGNVYYALRDTNRAAQAYARAATGFREQGKWEEAERLLEVVRGLDATLAAQLEADASPRAPAPTERRM